jgi:predicted transcriptional regulator
MMARRNLSISLPSEMVTLVDRAARVEHRTRSELVREALRAYLGRKIPVVEASKEERAAIKRGRREIERGQYVTLEQILHGMDRPARAPR